jgi:hypothetical protein
MITIDPASRDAPDVRCFEEDPSDIEALVEAWRAGLAV